MYTQAKKAAEAAAKPVSKKAALLDDSSEETDPTLYFENRVKGLNAKKAKGLNPYPHKFNVTLTLPEYVAKYANLEAGQRLDDVTVSVAGANTPWKGVAAAAAPAAAGTYSSSSSRYTQFKHMQQPAGAHSV
jgi:lysyl-tRNA synthetase class II